VAATGISNVACSIQIVLPRLDIVRPEPNAQGITVSCRMLPHCQCVAAFPHIYYFQLAFLRKLEFICLIMCQDVLRPM